MTPEERSLLEQTHALVKENNELLVSLKRRARLSMVMRILYWVAIIAVSLGAIYFIQPYINFLTGGGTSDTNLNQTLQDLLK